jgi:thioredoxin 1
LRVTITYNTTQWEYILAEIKEVTMAESKNVKEFTDDNFEAEVLKSDKPVLVDFWAVWCAPCRMVAPVVEEIADTYGGKIKVGKVNVDENSKTPNEYGIRSIPTIMLFKDGKVAEQVIGANPAEIKRIVEQNT